jgi:hypothetical protein
VREEVLECITLTDTISVGYEKSALTLQYVRGTYVLTDLCDVMRLITGRNLFSRMLSEDRQKTFSALKKWPLGYSSKEVQICGAATSYGGYSHNPTRIG